MCKSLIYYCKNRDYLKGCYLKPFNKTTRANFTAILIQNDKKGTMDN